MNPFEDLLNRMRAGDEAAAAEIFDKYAPGVKRVVRGYMRLLSVVGASDSSDIFQAVMASFFVRAALGQYDISEPDQLRALLIRMAKNKVTDLAKRPDRRTSRFSVFIPGVEPFEPADPAKGPADEIMWRELLQKVRDLLTEDERRVSDLRMIGHTWKEIGELLGEPADTVRRRLERALKRIHDEMKLEVLSDERTGNHAKLP